MNRKTLARIAFTAITVPTLAFGAPALAMADSFFNQDATGAGRGGAYSHNVTAYAKSGNSWGGGGWGGGWDNDRWGGGRGGSYFHESGTKAGPRGAATFGVTSFAR
ncbi:hypothetical protein [Nocardiopsis ansamitocini]|uniref:Lactococcin 972 family bacteriocin n=1 Tax=Nocardiopsis ansamitocini TaxID=1670832 RepID=A0A9W6PAL5_9ACTN|nr:hypothetical protein [Nocardiopsis ansamitocini]GLU50052.1 hypothetical protein Nans01_44030 [Nocardiopsis ansamitocini]